ncbi:hypothetical protein DFH08DRAFT_817037 [Mycena albidolilacea]|uniref:Uncharacterized protein n=1 Tax=Mycena albidolilacea TaxID=1033008 RepID=A0AAD7EI77_9AGAR|nr:hypothetical protein DFH08DRAFT_817037 [Mycena albidolilacea]
MREPPPPYRRRYSSAGTDGDDPYATGPYRNPLSAGSGSCTDPTIRIYEFSGDLKKKNRGLRIVRCFKSLEISSMVENSNRLRPDDLPAAAQRANFGSERRLPDSQLTLYSLRDWYMGVGEQEMSQVATLPGTVSLDVFATRRFEIVTVMIPIRLLQLCIGSLTTTTNLKLREIIHLMRVRMNRMPLTWHWIQYRVGAPWDKVKLASRFLPGPMRKRVWSATQSQWDW